MRAEVRWIEGLKFLGKTDSGHTIVMDSPEESGGENLAPTPMEITLSALGGCTGMDVISILKKMREEVSDFLIVINAERRTEHPRVFSAIELVYRFRGKNLKRENLEKAVKLSYEKYCSVGAMLKISCPITYKIEVITD
jgi:putative redox protein